MPILVNIITTIESNVVTDSLYQGLFFLVKSENSQTHLEPVLVVHKVANFAFFTKLQFLDQFSISYFFLLFLC